MSTSDSPTKSLHTPSLQSHQAEGKRVIALERDALTALLERIDDAFGQACEAILRCTGRVIVTGMGKSGHIGKKMAATLASTGTPAFFVHPAEASHGDLGMIKSDDVVLAISNSGKTDELLTILPLIKRMGAPMIAMTGDAQSSLAKQSDIFLDISVKEEACSLGLAPTASTTVTLALGDALAMALLKANAFTPDDFALAHPGGSLGKRLLLKVDDIMHAGEALPIASHKSMLPEVLLLMTEKRLGMAAIVDDHGLLVGIYTDGDVRRTLQRELDIKTTPISTIMSTECRTVHPGILAAEALKVMEQHRVNGLIIVDQQHRPVGALNMQDLLQAGVI